MGLLHTMLDVFTREWAEYAPGTGAIAAAAAAVEALPDALRRHPSADPPRPAMRSDHGGQYASKVFSSAIKSL